MIDTIELQNYQSHPSTKLYFHKNVNVIIGSSDTGKSAIIRAYRAFAENKSSGLAYVSDWIKTKGGSIKKGEECSVTITKHGVSAKRYRGDANGYSVAGKDLEAIGQDVPQEVHNFLNMDEVNLQRQLDAPFLLANTPGEVSRFFNRMIKLESIDKALSCIKSRKLETETALKKTLQDIEEIEKDQQQLHWLEKAQELLSSHDMLEKISTKKQNKLQELKRIVNECRVLSERIEKTESTIKAGERIDSLLLIKDRTVVLSEQMDRLRRYTQNLISCEKTLEATEEVEKVKESVKEVADTLKTVEDLQRKYNALKQLQSTVRKYDLIIEDRTFKKEKSIVKSLETIEKAIKELEQKTKSLEALQYAKRTANKYTLIIDEMEEEIEAKKKELPDECPICGNSMENCKEQL